MTQDLALRAAKALIEETPIDVGRELAQLLIHLVGEENGQMQPGCSLCDAAAVYARVLKGALHG